MNNYEFSLQHFVVEKPSKSNELRIGVSAGRFR